MLEQFKIEKAVEAGWPAMIPNAVELLQGQMQVLLDEQGELIQEAQRVAEAWTKRRQEAMQDNLQIFQTLCSGKEAGTMTAAYGEWLSNSMKRFLADMQDSRDEAL